MVREVSDVCADLDVGRTLRIDEGPVRYSCRCCDRSVRLAANGTVPALLVLQAARSITELASRSGPLDLALSLLQVALGMTEPLWTVRRDDRSVRAELERTLGVWEVRLFSDRQCFAAHRVGSRELALVWADAIYDGLVADGWILGSKAIHAPWGTLKNP